MGIFDFLKRPKPTQTTDNLIMLNGGGNFIVTDSNIYINDTIQGITNRIASAVQKTEARHFNAKGQQFTHIHKLLNIRPNPLMPVNSFYEMIVVQYLVNNNAIVYVDYGKDGKPKGLYPIDFNSCQFYSTPNGKIYVKVMDYNINAMLDYDSVIHLRRNFKNGLFGENVDSAIGQNVNLAESNNAALQSAVAKSGGLKGIIKYSTNLKETELVKAKDRFVSNYMDTTNTSSIGALGMNSEFIELKNNYSYLNTEQMKEVRENLYRYFGINDKIMMSEFTEVEYIAFIEQVIEPITSQMGSEFTYKLFTQAELDKGNRVVFENSKLQMGALTSKAAYVNIGLLNGTLTLNEARAIYNLEPSSSEFANQNRVRLDSANIELVDQYQISRANGDSNGSEIAKSYDINNFKQSEFKQFDYDFAKSKTSIDLSDWERVRAKHKNGEPFDEVDKDWLAKREETLKNLQGKTDELSTYMAISYGGVIYNQEQMKGVIKWNEKQ